MSTIFWTFKSKFQIIHVATYMTVFLPDSSNFLLYVAGTIFQHLSPLFFHFFVFISPSFP